MARKATKARKSKKASARKRTTTARVAPIPPGMRTVTPYLVINGAAKAIEFYKKAFGAKEITRQGMPDGTLMHATIKIGDSLVMMSDEFPGSDTKSPNSAGGTTFNLHVYTKDVDKLWNQALAAGARCTTVGARPTSRHCEASPSRSGGANESHCSAATAPARRRSSGSPRPFSSRRLDKSKCSATMS